MKKAVKYWIILFCLVVSGKAYGACNVTTTGIAFGSYDVFSAIPADSTGTVTVTCDAATKVTISLGPSSTSGVFNPRQMRLLSTGDLMSYNLYTDPARAVVWGDGTSGTSTVTDNIPKNKSRSQTVYGRISAGQDVSAGLYSDTLIVTVLW